MLECGWGGWFGAARVFGCVAAGVFWLREQRFYSRMVVAGLQLSGFSLAVRLFFWLQQGRRGALFFPSQRAKRVEGSLTASRKESANARKSPQFYKVFLILRSTCL